MLEVVLNVCHVRYCTLNLYLNDAADNRTNSVMTFAFVLFVFVNSAREKNLGTCQQRRIGAKRDIAARDTVDVVSGKW